MLSDAATASSPPVDADRVLIRSRSSILISGYNASISDASQQKQQTEAQHDDQNTSLHALNAPTSLMTVILLIPSLPRTMLLLMIRWYTEFLGNVLFFLYVCKNFLHELWDLEKAAVESVVPLRIHKQNKASNVPDVVSRDFSDEYKHAPSVARDREWFLSEQSFPEATKAERARFLKARDGDVPAASAMLKKYLEWRKQFDAMEDEQLLYSCSMGANEEDPDWTRACRMASVSSSSPLPAIPPCILFMPDKADTDPSDSQKSLRTLDGKRVLQHLPARIDLSVADGELYAIALALYIDCCVSRDSMEKICVVIDTRPGKGWGNIPAPKLIPFIKNAARLLNDLHPERLARCILFPVPSVAKFLWNAVKPWLDPGTADKICILSGSAGIKSPVPNDMDSYLQKDVVEWMEWKRVSTFEEGSTKRKLEEKLSSSFVT